MITLSGCSDEGDSGDDGSLTGFILPTGLSGVPYETETRSGLTGRNGEFRFLEGETVTFRIGDLVFADKVVAKQFMTTIDFEPDLAATINTGEIDRSLSLHENLEQAASRDNRVVNKLAMLHSLDENALPDDGIEVTENTRTSIEASELAATIDFSISPLLFEKSDSVASVMLNTICFSDDTDCSDGDGRAVEDLRFSIDDYLDENLPARYFDIAERIYLRPEVFQINAGDTRLFTVSLQILGLYGKLLQMEVATADELAQLSETPPPIEKSVVGIDSFSTESGGTVTFYATGAAGDETEVVVNIKLDNDYRWFKKTFRVQLL